MSSVWRSRERTRLISELQSEEYLRLLQRLQEGSPFLQRFRSWPDVLDFMSGGHASDPAKDWVLVPIFRAYREDEDSRWLTVLWAIFWPGLASIQNIRWKWDQDKAELWQNILTTFFRVIRRIDIAIRSDRLAQKVYNDTVHDLYEAYEREWLRQERTHTLARKELEKLIVPIEGDWHGPEAEDERQVQIKALRTALQSGRIDESDYLVLLGTRIYGQSVAAYARDHNLNYQAVKKRRQRAERTLNKYRNA